MTKDVPMELFGLMPGYFATQPMRIYTIMNNIKIKQIPMGPETLSAVYFYPSGGPRGREKIGLPVGKISVCGWIVAIKPSNKFVNFYLDDGSGSVLLCSMFLKGGMRAYDAFLKKHPLGSVVRVQGKLNEYMEERKLSTYDLRCMDARREMLHWVQASRHLEFMSKFDYSAYVKKLQGLDADLVLEDGTLSESAFRALVKSTFGNVSEPFSFRQVSEHPELADYAKRYLQATSSPSRQLSDLVHALFARTMNHLIREGFCYIVADSMDVYEVIGNHNLGRDILLLVQSFAPTLSHLDQEADKTDEDEIIPSSQPEAPTRITHLLQQLDASELERVRGAVSAVKQEPKGLKEDVILFEMRRIPQYASIGLKQVRMCIEHLVQMSLIYECEYHAYVSLDD